MIIPIIITDSNSCDFSYESSIDSETYNKIRLVYEDEDAGISVPYEVEDKETQATWGILQYYDTLKEGENGLYKANVLLSLYNRKTRQLSIEGVFGDIRVRAGCSVLVRMDLGELSTDTFMIVNKCTHNFNNDEHLMDLELIVPF